MLTLIYMKDSQLSAGVQTGIAEAVQNILVFIGEDPLREGLLQTPQRVERMYVELTEGYRMNLTELINGAIFEVDYTEMVTMIDIEFSSLSEHHLLPFFGKVHIAYIPGGSVIGLSKIPRIIEMYARRLQMQERMTPQIAEALEITLRPRGVAVVVEAQASEELKARGVAILPIESDPFGQYARFTDPDGNGLVLRQKAPAA